MIVYPVKYTVNEFLADRVMSPCIVIRGILLSTNHLLGMEHCPVLSRSNFVHHCRLKVDKNGSRDVVTRSRLVEKSGEGVVFALFRVNQFPVRSYFVFETVELPAGTAHLDSSLPDVNRNDFSLREKKGYSRLHPNSSLPFCKSIKSQ